MDATRIAEKGIKELPGTLGDAIDELENDPVIAWEATTGTEVRPGRPCAAFWRLRLACQARGCPVATRSRMAAASGATAEG